VVATANDISQLPPELLRKGRLDEIFFVDLPDKEERVEIFGIHIAKRGRDATAFDLEALAEVSRDFSGRKSKRRSTARYTTRFTTNKTFAPNTS